MCSKIDQRLRQQISRAGKVWFLLLVRAKVADDTFRPHLSSNQRLHHQISHTCYSGENHFFITKNLRYYHRSVHLLSYLKLYGLVAQM